MSAHQAAIAPQFLESVSTIALRLHQATDFPSIVQITIQEVGRLLNSDGVDLYRVIRGEHVERVTPVVPCEAPPPETIPQIIPCLQHWITTPSVKTLFTVPQAYLLPDPAEQATLHPIAMPPSLWVPIYLPSQWPKANQGTSQSPVPPENPLLWGVLVVSDHQATRQWNPLECSFLRQLTDHLAAAIQQVQRRQFYDCLIESASDSMVAFDTEGYCQIWNRAMEQLTGIPQHEVLGKPITTGSPLEQLFPNQALMQAAINGQEVVAYEQSFVNPHTGRTGCFDARYGPLVDAVGTTLGSFGVMRDISDRKFIQQQLEQARLTAEQANQAKSTFLATVSHEVRTPLNAVMGITELLTQTSLDAEQHEFVEIIHTSSALLLSIINDILDFSKIEAERLDLEWRPFNLHRCIQESVKLLTPLAAEKNLPLRWTIEPQVPSHVVADVTRLRQILVNLINNAIKFTEAGQVEVQVSVPQMPQPSETTVGIRFVVKDTGIGISAAQQAHLFQAFRQLDASITRRYGGTGLGLAISKNLVTALGGELTVESQVGVGSTFTFTLQMPIATPEDYALINHEEVSSGSLDRAQALESQRQAINAEVLPLKVLVVDDLTVNLKVAQRMLAYLGYEADVVNRGQAAIAALSHTQYDVILMDIQMPEMDGYETTQTIRQLPQSTPTTPWIIAITAHAQKENRDRCLAVGMNDYLSKPILLSALVSGLQHYRQAQQPPLPNPIPFEPDRPDSSSPQLSAPDQPPTPATTPTTPASLTILDPKPLNDIRDMVGEEADVFIAEILNNYRDDSLQTLQNLLQALEQEAGDQVHYHAHALGSMSLNIGAIALGTLCRNLETHYTQQAWSRNQAAGLEIRQALHATHHALAISSNLSNPA